MLTLASLLRSINGAFDNRRVSRTISATNTIVNGGVAVYVAGQNIRFRPGFKANGGSNLHAFVMTCVSAKTQSELSSIENIKEGSETSIASLSVFPNPNHGEFSVQIPEMNLDEGIKQEIRLYDNLGNLVLKKSVSPGKKLDFDMSTFAQGLYLIKYQDSNGVIIQPRPKESIY